MAEYTTALIILAIIIVAIFVWFKAWAKSESSHKKSAFMGPPSWSPAAQINPNYPCFVSSSDTARNLCGVV